MERTASGMNIRLSRLPPGFSWGRCISRTCFPISQLSARWMVSGSGVVVIGLQRRDSASGLAFLDPSQYEREKLNRVNSRIHLA